MPGLLASIRALFVGQDDAPAAPRRVGAGAAGRLDTSASPVPADSQELVMMARDFRTFLDLQEQRQQELARVVATLPQSMGALPELVRQQTRLADLVAQQLMLTRQRDDQVEKTLARITQGVEQQRDVMGLVQQQLDLNHESAMKVADGVTTLAGAVVQLQETSDRGSVALQRILERTADRDAGVQKLHATLQNWMLFVAILSCMTLVGAVILAWIVLHAPVREAGAGPVAAPAVTALQDAGNAAPTGEPRTAELPQAPPPTGSTMPALGGAPEPASGSALPATGGAAPR
jgi:hypothetical protein